MSLRTPAARGSQLEPPSESVDDVPSPESRAVEPEPNPPRDAPAGLRRRRRWVAVLATPALVQPAATALARWDWRADVLTHFQVPALVASIVAAALLWRLGRWRWPALTMLGLAALQSACLLRYELPNPVPPAPGDPFRLRVLVCNVMRTNYHPEPLIDLIRRERPDVVALVEFSERWRRKLAPVREAYPHRIEIPMDTLGLALYSRYPILGDPAPDLIVPTEGAHPALAAAIDAPGGPIDVWVLHPLNPVIGDGGPLTPGEWLLLAEHIGKRPGAKLVVGDMNRTEGSPLFHDFLRMTDLRDGRIGFGRQPSWPTFLPTRLPLDHTFLGPELAVIDRRLGPDVGSDHFPIVLDLGRAGADSEAIASPSQLDSSGPP